MFPRLLSFNDFALVGNVGLGPGNGGAGPLAGEEVPNDVFDLRAGGGGGGALRPKILASCWRAVDVAEPECERECCEESPRDVEEPWRAFPWYCPLWPSVEAEGEGFKSPSS